jgi:hypothetical protein
MSLFDDDESDDDDPYGHVQRRLDWSDGVQVEMTDGCEWTLPMIDSRVLAIAPQLPDLISTLDCRVEAFRTEAVKMIASMLLSANYEISAHDAVLLVPLEFNQDEVGNFGHSSRFFSLSIAIRGLASLAGLTTDPIIKPFVERSSTIFLN